MNARRLEEIFEECVSAYLEGRRSIQESLQLYPAYSAELAPLLQTAVQLNDSFGKITPPANVQNRVHARFLSDARSRRQVRTLTRGHGRSALFAGFWERQRFGFATGGAIAVLVVAVASAAMLLGGGTTSEPGVTHITPAPTAGVPRPTPESVLAIRAKIDEITGRIQRGEQINAEDLSELQSATNAVVQQDVDDSRDQVEQTLQAANALVTVVINQQPELAQPAQAAQDTLRSVASTFDIDLGATPTPTASPVPPTEPPTTAPTPAPTAEPTAAPTLEPTPVPTDVPPTPSPVRGLPGGE